MYSGFTIDQVNAIGEHLQLLYNHIAQTSCIIINAYPMQNRASEIVKKFNMGGLEDLRNSLNNHAIDDPTKNPDHVDKMYHKNGQPEFDCPEFLPGVPSDLAAQFHLIQEDKGRRPGCNHKEGLSAVEIEILLTFFNHCISTIERIKDEIIRAYGEKHQAVILADFSLLKFNNLKYGLMTLPPGRQGVNA